MLATLIGLALAVPAALCLARFNFACARRAHILLLMPLIVPGVVLGTAIYVFQVEAENRARLPTCSAPSHGLVAGHVVIVIPWIVRLVTASLAGLDRTIEEAAQNLGANALDDLPARHLSRDPARASSPARCSASSSRSAISR